MALIEKITAVADAIRAKTGSSAAMTLDGMAEAVEGIQTGGNGDGYDVVDALIDRSITEISSNVEKIGDNAFSTCSKLTAVDFPMVKSIGSYAFEACSALTALTFPVVASIGHSAFRECPALTTVNFPLVNVVSTYAFFDCTALTNVTFPVATSIDGDAFRECSALVNVTFPVVTSIGEAAFRGCSALTTVNFPLITNISKYAFRDCSSLTGLILRSETICKLSNTNALQNCYHILGTTDATYNPDGLKDGYIYVPAALVDSYKSATNWSTYATQFRALEDYTVDGTITGALDPNKI